MGRVARWWRGAQVGGEWRVGGGAPRWGASGALVEARPGGCRVARWWRGAQVGAEWRVGGGAPRWVPSGALVEGRLGWVPSGALVEARPGGRRVVCRRGRAQVGAERCAGGGAPTWGRAVRRWRRAQVGPRVRRWRRAQVGPSGASVEAHPGGAEWRVGGGAPRWVPSGALVEARPGGRRVVCRWGRAQAGAEWCAGGGAPRRAQSGVPVGAHPRGAERCAGAQVEPSGASVEAHPTWVRVRADGGAPASKEGAHVGPIAYIGGGPPTWGRAER